MPPLVRRIVVNGLMTAGILGVLGMFYAEMASAWLASNQPIRTTAVESSTAAAPVPDAVGEELRSRLPLTLAAWGFGFIAIGELVLYAWRGSPPNLADKKLTKDQTPDAAELLLEKLLAEADAALAASQKPADSEQRSEISGQKSEPQAEAPAILSSDL